jgi:hypothetical protein
MMWNDPIWKLILIGMFFAVTWRLGDILRALERIEKTLNK